MPQNALDSMALANSYDRELQNYMFAKGQPDFAFQVIDAPSIPDTWERVFPNRPLFAILGVVFGHGSGGGRGLDRGRAHPASEHVFAVIYA